jgi:hypothetical protein
VKEERAKAETRYAEKGKGNDKRRMSRRIVSFRTKKPTLSVPQRAERVGFEIGDRMIG